MFRAVLCSSSGGQIVCIQHIVSSLSMSGHGGRTVRRYCMTTVLYSILRPPRPLTESDGTICCIHKI